MNIGAKQKIKIVRDFLKNVREIEGDMSIRRLQTLLEVYHHSEIELATLLKNLKYTSAGATKVVQSWTDLDAYKRPGPGYIKSEIRPEDMRHRHLSLTPKGKAIVERFTK